MIEQTLKSDSNLMAFNKGFISYLLESGYVSEDQLIVAEKELADRPRLSLIDSLSDLGLVDQNTLALAWSEYHNNMVINLSEKTIDQAILNKWPEKMAQRFSCLVIEEKQKDVLAVAAEPDSIYLKDTLEQYFPDKSIAIQPATYRDIHQKLNTVYKISDLFSHRLTALHQHFNATPQKAANSENSVVNVIETTIENALNHGASDIHFLPQDAFVQLLYRIDGQLTPMRTIHKKFWPALSSRLKVLADLNLAESRLPQNGRFSIEFQRRPIDCRLSTHPSTHGESLVVRLLDKHTLPPELENLGFERNMLLALKNCMQQPHGLFLVIGPTGSGKTTTLHALLNLINHTSIKIMTLEQPIEYIQPKLCQTEVPEEGPLTFAQGVRSMLRQDPDVMLIGEIRDEDTAQMAIRASLTGHLVLSTLHAANAESALQRLYNLGLMPDLLKTSLSGLLTQRLLRRSCTCIRTKNSGCTLCHQTGYKGRLSIGELHAFDQTSGRLVCQTPSIYDNARNLINTHITTELESERVLGPMTQWVQVSKKS